MSSKTTVFLFRLNLNQPDIKKDENLKALREAVQTDTNLAHNADTFKFLQDDKYIELAAAHDTGSYVYQDAEKTAVALSQLDGVNNVLLATYVDTHLFSMAVFGARFEDEINVKIDYNRSLHQELDEKLALSIADTVRSLNGF